MQYSDIIGIEQFFDSTFNLTEERENYWKQFITNPKFESNLKEIINAFDSTSPEMQKSIWVQGTYGTGKSHSTAVTMHLLSDEYDDIIDYIEKLDNEQVKAKLKGFRKKTKIFPVVLKGTYSIIDTEELKYTIQRAVSQKLVQSNISITVKSDFDAVLEMLNDAKFFSFWNSMLENELCRYASTKEELKQLLSAGDVEVLKEVNKALKNANMIKATPDIKKWLTEVMMEIRKQGIADYLVIFWDEFTSLLEISERRSILNCMQDIAELSKAPCAEDKKKNIGVYVFLITHKSMEATDSYKELKEDEKTMAKARFINLQYDMQDITTYHILANALKIKDKTKYHKLVNTRVINHSEVAHALKEIVAPLDRSAETERMIQNLYPFHPYTAYLATFVSRAIGSAERSIFEFLNDSNRGFKKFLTFDLDTKSYLTADRVWDFFMEAFSEDRTNNFDSILNKYSIYGSKLEDTDIPELSAFKVILLLNLLNRVTQMDNDFHEKNLVSPSKKTILNVLSGAWPSDSILKALESINEKQIVLKGPDDVFEVSSSVLPMEKIQNEKNKQYLAYKEAVSVFDNYYGYKYDIKHAITNNELFNREADIQLINGNLQSVSSFQSKVFNKFNNAYSVRIAIMLFRGSTPLFDKILQPENSIEEQKNLIQSVSKNEIFDNFIFVVSDIPLGQQRFEGFIDARARCDVAKSTKTENPGLYEQKASRWVEQWKEDIINGSATIIFRGERVNATSLKAVCNSGLLADVARIFSSGAERLQAISKAATSWTQSFRKTTVGKVCEANYRSDLENLKSIEAPIVYLLKDSKGKWLFDERLNYIGEFDPMCPMCILIKAINDRIAEKRNVTLVDIGTEFKFLTEPPFGYYNNTICMASVALAFRQYIGKMYLSDQGSLVTANIMRDIIVAAFHYWIENKKDAKLRVRFSTAEEKELIDLIQTIFGVNGDGISETKWALRTKFQEKYKAPLWAIKYVVDKGSEFNDVIDTLFTIAVATGESITQDDIKSLLDGIKIQKTSIALSLEKVTDASCLFPYIDKCLEPVGIKLNDYSNLLEYLKQNLSDEIVFWKEGDVEKQILTWQVLQGKQNDFSEENEGEQEYVDLIQEEDNSDDAEIEEDLDNSFEDDLFNVPEFEPIEITPIEMGKSHITIEAATSLITTKEFSIDEAKDILIKLCKKYPVVCSAVIDLVSEE